MAMKHGGNVWEGGAPGRWLDFSANLRPEGTPLWVMHAMQEALADTRYYPDRTMTAARRGLAVYAGVSQDCILPTAGGAAAIDLVLSLGTGTVLVQTPTFGEYPRRAGVHGRSVAVWKGACQKGDTLVLCNPGNPTGHAYAKEEILSIFETVCSSGADLIIDEAFIDFCPQHSVRSDVQPGLIVVGSLTKTLCIPGVRLGYVCAEPEVIRRLERQALPWAVSTLAQAVAAKLPEHLKEIQRDAEINRIRRETLKASLEALGAKVLPSQANFLLADFGMDMTQAAANLKKRNILVRTCASFGLPDSVWRLAVRTEGENARLIACLQEVLHAR
ncbi:MAG: histidinol-phosphate aminotransferase family protein [Clostridia bacterium]|nr:histidinol-phosphate aminotransferase family protein [Clostridia bacterium]